MGKILVLQLLDSNAKNTAAFRNVGNNQSKWQNVEEDWNLQR
jgi:hypothetical protein